MQAHPGFGEAQQNLELPANQEVPPGEDAGARVPWRCSRFFRNDPLLRAGEPLEHWIVVGLHLESARALPTEPLRGVRRDSERPRLPIGHGPLPQHGILPAADRSLDRVRLKLAISTDGSRAAPGPRLHPSPAHVEVVHLRHHL